MEAEYLKLEPVKTPLNKEETQALTSICTRWLPTLDGRRTSYSAETITLLIKMFKYRKKGTIIVFGESLPEKLS